MGNIDWAKIKQALLSHEWLALGLGVWLLAIALYVILQVRFCYAWTGRWRIAALLPLLGLCILVAAFVIGQAYDPEVFGPSAAALDNLILALLFGGPIGCIYLVIVGIVHRNRGKRAPPDR